MVSFLHRCQGNVLASFQQMVLEQLETHMLKKWHSDPSPYDTEKGIIDLCKI